MDFQKIMDNMTLANMNDRMKTSPQLTVGELILKLEAVEKKDVGIRFDFEYLKPSNFMSWRGSYIELAIGFTEEKTELDTVEKFLVELKACIGKTFEGYKGGDYVMGKNTPIWVANYGNAGDTGIVNILVDEYEVVLVTGKCDF